MSYIKVWIHFVWGTKNRAPMLSLPKERKIILSHIKENAKAKGIHIDCINGVDDHVHCLVSMNGDQSMATIMNLIKGESSFWANKNNTLPWKLQWQNDYYAGSVSPSQIQNVRNYIYNQEAHHKVESYNDEFDRLVQEQEKDQVQPSSEMM